ncbi:CDP-glycerol glycerophosphotransferase family protein [Bacillus mycoides]|uniref:CDP-glycerol glycerophosphotransferase family protein n=1 Tax=Bacillus mycoides TaxID=1405 RepID=UPI003D66296B
MKKILFNTYNEGNITALINYYNQYLKSEYDNKIKIEYVNHYKYKDSKVAKFLKRAIDILGRYDLIVSDYPTKLYATSKKGIFVSHGYGTKKTPGNDELDNKKTMGFYRSMRKNVDYIVTLSQRDEEYYMRHESLEKYNLPKYVPLGLPRNDMLFDSIQIKNNTRNLKRELGIEENEKVVLYAPTWRGDSLKSDFNFSREDFIQLNEFLKKNNCKFLYRGHYLEGIVTNELITGLSNIKTVGFEEEPDTQKILCATDLLITDYSSIYIDFLAVGKAMAFLPFDKERYENYRGLAIDFNNDIETPGPKLNSMKELMEYIDDVIKGKDDYKLVRKQSQKLYYHYFDGESCKRFWDLIIKELNM